MKSYIQVLGWQRKKKEGDGFNINVLTRADMQVRKMTSLIQDFLDLARFEEGKIHLHREEFELEPLVAEIITEAQFLTSNHKIEFKECGLIMINAD